MHITLTPLSKLLARKQFQLKYQQIEIVQVLLTYSFKTKINKHKIAKIDNY